MFKDLKGKTAIITGGAGYFGSQIRDALISQNSNVIILDNSKNKKKHHRLYYYTCNITENFSVAKISTEIQRKFKNIDILINNAATDLLKNEVTNKSKLEKFDHNKWMKEIDLGISGSLNCIKFFGRLMAKQKNGGVILNLSTDNAIITQKSKKYKKLNMMNSVSHSVIKHGIIGLTKHVASYWGKQKIRCNTLTISDINRNSNKVLRNQIKKSIPLKRIAKINEHNDIALFLCSSESSYITGTTIISDGGLTII